MMMAKPFLRVLPLDDGRELLRSFGPLDTAEVQLQDAVFRVIAEPVTAGEDLPGFGRSTMDGFAVRSVDTFGATESSPALFTVTGEVTMGEVGEFTVGKGEAVRVWTGGALPESCDAVVMVEHTQELDDRTIEVFKAVAPFENVVRRGEDFEKGRTLLKAGHRLRPQEIGLLAALGMPTVRVHQRPCVAILSSGDEIVPIEESPPPGCMRDVNRYSLHAMVLQAHGEPVWVGIAPDRLRDLRSLVEKGIEFGDVTLISGGSSMGSRDLVIEVLNGFPDSEILLHGVSISPGKPLIVARVGTHPVIGLPGHPVSAMVCFEQFVVPLMRRLEGENTLKPFLYPACRAVLSRNVPSREGRTDFVRVRLSTKEGDLTAVPVPGKSGMISPMVRAHGCIRIDADCEGLYKGDRVEVHLFANWIEDAVEKKHLSGHEASGGSAGGIFETPEQERLSKL
jgi:molybdopterin molybdotransferase